MKILIKVLYIISLVFSLSMALTISCSSSDDDDDDNNDDNDDSISGDVVEGDMGFYHRGAVECYGEDAEEFEADILHVSPDGDDDGDLAGCEAPVAEPLGQPV